MAWGTLGSSETLLGASGRSWTLRFERRLAPRPGLQENPASSVWLVRESASARLYAAKRQSLGAAHEVDALVDDAAAWRAACLASGGQPVVVELVDVFVMRDPPYSVTFLAESCSRGHIPRSPKLSEDCLLTIAADLASAVADARAPHGNITYESVLVDEEGRVRLAGFGAHRSAILRDNPDLSPLDDIFDIALLMYQLMFGKRPTPPSLDFPASVAPYTPRILDIVTAMFAPPETRLDPLQVVDMVRAAGGELRAPIINVNAGAATTGTLPAASGSPQKLSASVERSVERLSSGIDAAGAYSALMSAMDAEPEAGPDSVFAALFKCPMSTDPLCAMRCLTMLHNLMIDGPSSVLDSVRKNDKFLDWAESSWTREAVAANAKPDDVHPATFCFSGGELAFYASLLRRKARFHMLAAGGFTGSWERTGALNNDGRDVLVTRRRKVVLGMADVIEMAAELGIRFAEAVDEEAAIKHASLRAIVDECARACNAALGMAGETESVKDAQKLVPGIERLYNATRGIVYAVRGVRAAGGEQWAEQFADEAPPDIVADAEFRHRNIIGADVAEDIPDDGWEAAESMVAAEAEAEAMAKKAEKMARKEARRLAREEKATKKITADDGAMVLHGVGEAEAQAVATMFGDLLALDEGNDRHIALPEQPAGPLPQMSNAQALAAAFGAPQSGVVGQHPALPAPGDYDDEDSGGGYDDFRARQEEDQLRKQQEREESSTAAWAARAGYSGGALVVSGPNPVTSKPHPVFCQCALCQRAEAQEAAATVAARAENGYSDDGYSPVAPPSREETDSYAMGTAMGTAASTNRNGINGFAPPGGAQAQSMQPERGSYYQNDYDSYESITYSVEEEHASNGAGDDDAYQSELRAAFIPEPVSAPEPKAPAAPAALDPKFALVMKKVRLGDKIADSTFSVVYKGEYNREVVAIKKMSRVMMASAAAMAEFRNEVTTMCSFSHPNVLRCIGACLTGPNIMLVTEFMKRGTLFDVLHKERIKLTWALIRKIALQVASGMAYIHEQGMVHRDLKSTNIMVDSGYNIKIGDFGLTLPQNAQEPAGIAGTYQYMAPEVLRGEPHSVKSDVFAFGQILCETIAGSPPFFGVDPREVGELVVNQDARPQIPQHCQRAYASLIQSCWAAVPAIRPSFTEVVSIINTTTK